NLPADGEIGGPDRAQGADGHDVGDREHEGGLAGVAHVPFRDEVGHRLLATLAVETGAPHDRFPAAAGGETLGETGDAVIRGADPLARGEDDRAPIAQPDHLGAQQPGPAAVVHSEPTYVRVVVVAEGDDGGPGADEVGGGLGDRGAGAGGGEDDRPWALAAQGLQERGFAGGVAVRRRYRHHEASVGGCQRVPGGDVGEVGVGDVGDEQGDDAGGPPRGRLRREVRGVAELLGCLKHPALVGRGDLPGGTVEYRRRGGQRRPGEPRDGRDTGWYR